FRGDRFWKTVDGVLFLVERLPLKIGELDEITIDDTQCPDSGARESLGVRCSESPSTYQKHARVRQPLLAFHADLTEENLSAVPLVHSTQKTTLADRGVLLSFPRQI